MSTARNPTARPDRRPPVSPRLPGSLRRRPRLLRTAAIVAGVLALLFIATFFVDEPIRRSMERRMNESLDGYSVSIPKLNFSLIGLSVTLHDLTVRQKAHPEPALAVFPRLRASVQWKELLRAKLVADFQIDRPRIHVNLAQLREEARDSRPVKDKGWQQAVQEIYPLKINHFDVRDGAITYIDADPEHPLTLTAVNLRASNIRNIRSRERFYPSPIHMDATILESGRGVVDGHANFLAEPFAAVHALVELQGISLDKLGPVVQRANLAVKGGVLSLDGRVEYGPTFRAAHLRDLTVQGLKVDYTHSAATAPAEKRRAEDVRQAANQAAADPRAVYRVDRLRLLDSDFGFVNAARDPKYRVFLSDAELTVENFSTAYQAGPAKILLTGRFMGKGAARAAMTIRPEKNGGPDFDARVAIEDTPLTSLNDVLRAYGKFDVVGGQFSFFTELAVANGRIDGYVKPLFKDMDVYDRRQDAEKGLFRKLYEKIVDGVSDLLKNRRDDVATKADISGPVSNPDSSTLQVVLRLIENAFFRAILPGFDEELERSGKRR